MESEGNGAAAYSLYMAIYAASRRATALLSAARVKLRQLGDPAVAAAAVREMVEVRNRSAQEEGAARPSSRLSL